MKSTLLLLLLYLSLSTFAQDTLNGKCWTPELDTTEFQNQPWFSNNDYLEHFLDSIGYPGSAGRIVGPPQVKFWIPIKFWIYRDDNGNGGPTMQQLQNLMDNLNRRYNQTNNAWIGFYMKCDPTYINNSHHLVKTFTGASILMAENVDMGSINVHIIERFHSIGTAGFSIPFLNASMIPYTAFLDPRANGDLAHEIGHVLGLQHTHQYSAWNWRCLTECVSRTRTWPTFNICPTRLISNRVCEATGDGLRDTQADDNLVSNNECFYNVTFGDDEWGDSYDNPPAGIQDRPNVRNIMSYNSATNCVDQFSRLQIGVMLWTLYFKKTNNLGGWANPVSTFDDFEPDNYPDIARDIQIFQVQERNFHQQWNRVGPYGYINQCDVDWVRFVAPCSANFEVFTSAISGREDANTRLTIFDNTLSQLAQNDDISSINLYSSIQFNFIAGREYFIRVENMNMQLGTEYYNLQIGRSMEIAGDDIFCTTSNSYSISNLPAGAIVTWETIPQGIATPSCNPCNPVTMARNISGNITLQATITNACGLPPVTLIKPNITVGPPAGIGIAQTNNLGNCDGDSYFQVLPSDPPGYFQYSGTLTVSELSGIVSNITWALAPYTTSTGWVWSSSGNTVTLSSHGTTHYLSLRATATNSCGTVYKDYIFTTNECIGVEIVSQVEDLSYIVSPNPTSNTLSITSKSTDPAVFIKEVIIQNKFGAEVKHIKYQNGSKALTLDVQSLTTDVYVVQIFNGKQWVSKKIIKQ